MENKETILVSTAALAVFLVAGLFCQPLFVCSETEDEDDSEDEEALEKQEEVKEDIGDIEKKLEKEQETKEKLEQQLYQIQTSVNQTQYEIYKTQSHIQDAEQNIARGEKEVENLNNKTRLQREILGGLVRQMHFQESDLKNTFFIGNSSLIRLTGQWEQLSLLEQKIISVIEDIRSAKIQIEEELNELEEAKKEKRQLLSLKEGQQRVLLTEKNEAQFNVQKKEATIAELNAKLYKLRSELSSLLGKSYNFDDILDAARFASKATGVRKDFILGMLVVESDLGRFTGGCDYKESRMSDYRKEIFKDICDELDYDYKKMKVSCPPSGYSGTGGAMGVAQFMPDTWLGYKNQIASITGHDPPDPWNLTDGVVGMALKLAKGGATSKSGECNAAKLYLSGTTSSSYNWYCERVKYWADNYERLLD